MGSVAWKGEQYELLQFHVHVKSEHQFDQRQADAEIHFVHQKKGAKKLDDLLVVGVMLKTGWLERRVGEKNRGWTYTISPK